MVFVIDQNVAEVHSKLQQTNSYIFGCQNICSAVQCCAVQCGYWQLPVTGIKRSIRENYSVRIKALSLGRVDLHFCWLIIGEFWHAQTMKQM